MSAIRSILRNSLFLLLSYVVSSAFNFFFLAYVTRALVGGGFGMLSYALAFVSIFNVLNDLGVSTIMMREVARDKTVAPKYLANVIAIKTVFIIVTMLLIVGTAYALNISGDIFNVILLIAVSNIALSISSMLNSLFQAYERMEFQSISGILSSGLMLTGAAYAYYSHLGVYEFAWLYVITNTIIMIYSIAVCSWQFFLPRIGFDLSFCRQIIKEAWPMGIMALSVLIYSRVDTLMLEPMKGFGAVELYSAAYRLSEMSTFVAVIFTASIFPIISKYHKDSPSSFTFAYEKSVKFLLIIALPMAMTVTLLAPQIIMLINGSGYEGSVSALQILIWTAVLIYLTMVLNNTLVNANLQRLSMIVVTGSIFVNVGLNLLMIPAYSYIGASIATLATQIFVLVIDIYFMHHYGYRINLPSVFLPPLFNIAIAGGVALILLYIGVNVFIVAAISVMLYSILTITIGLERSDRMLLSSIINH